MSSPQLQSIFHVDNADSVPHYEIIKLTHHSSDSSSRKKRAIDNSYSNSENSKNSNKINNNNNKLENSADSPHHVKKDLSKASYFSETKVNSLNINNNNNADSIKKSIKLNEKDLLSDSETNNDGDNKEHNVSFIAFGEVMNLTLKPTEGLFKDGPSSLKMWAVKPDDKASEGLDYEEIVTTVRYDISIF